MIDSIKDRITNLEQTNQSNQNKLNDLTMQNIIKIISGTISYKNNHAQDPDEYSLSREIGNMFK